MSLSTIDRRCQDPPCECGDPWCAGCDWDDDDDDEDIPEPFDEEEPYDDFFDYNNDDKSQDDSVEEGLSVLEQPLTQDDEDEIPF